MKKRFTFECWNCRKTYTLFREITDQQSIIVACPFCGAEGVVDLRPYPPVTEALRGDGDDIAVAERQWPDVFPTQPPATSPNHEM